MYFITASQMLSLFAIIVAGILLAVSVRRFRMNTQKTKEKDTSFLVVKEIFSNIIQARAIIELMLEQDGKEILACSGICIDVDQFSISLLMHKSYLRKEDLLKKVHGYCTFIQNEKRHFYDFYTTIDRVYEKNNQPCLVLKRPELISNNQKRRFVRLEPPSSIFRSLQLWIMKTTDDAQSSQEFLPKKFSLWPVSADSLQVRNISAGGLLLRVQSAPSALAELARSRFLVVRMVMAADDRPESPSVEMRVVGRSCRITQDGPDTLSFGLEFLRYYQPGAEPGQAQWRIVDPDDGVPALAAAVMRLDRLNNQLKSSIKPLETLPPVLGKKS